MTNTDEMKKNNPYRYIAYLGLSLVLMSIVLMAIMPHKVHNLPDGLKTPILGFEFAQSTHDIYGIFYNEIGNIDQNIVASMDLGNILDFVYMIQYSLFLMLFCLITFRLTKKYVLFIPAFLSILALAGDALENSQLLGITTNLASGDYMHQLFYLHYFTWIKWASLSLIFLMLPLFIYRKGLLSKICVILGSVIFGLGAVSFFHRSIANELFSLSIAIMFILLIVYSFSFNSWRKKHGISF